MPERQPQLVEGRVLVVLDVNIFLDVARATGEPFSWEKLLELRASGKIPPSVETVLSLKNGTLPDGRRVEVWTSNHIDRLVALKASQPTTELDERDRGLGWSVASAQHLIDTLVTDVVVGSAGGNVGEVNISYGTPPLSHEDGCVYATAKDAGDADVFYDERYCITRDGHFLRSRLPGLIDVIHPDAWILKHRALTRAMAFKKMLRRTVAEASSPREPGRQ